MVNYYIRNNEIDFQRWYLHIVPYALADLKMFKLGKSTYIFHEDYDDAINVKRQMRGIEALLTERHTWFLEEVLVRHKPIYICKDGYKLYKELYEAWRTVCFPKGKSQLKSIDPVLLGGELRRKRMEKCIPAKHVAGLVGISEKTLYCYEEGTREIRVDTFYKMCQVYKADLKEIIDKTAI